MDLFLVVLYKIVMISEKYDNKYVDISAIRFITFISIISSANLNAADQIILAKQQMDITYASPPQ